jgi:hypothetical protein
MVPESSESHLVDLSAKPSPDLSANGQTATRGYAQRVPRAVCRSPSLLPGKELFAHEVERVQGLPCHTP